MAVVPSNVSSLVLGPLTCHLQPQQSVFIETPHSLRPQLQPHLLGTQPSINLHAAFRPHLVVEPSAPKSRQIALCVAIIPTGPLNLSTCCFAHPRGLALNQLKGERSGGTPSTPTPTVPLGAGWDEEAMEETVQCPSLCRPSGWLPAVPRTAAALGQVGPSLSPIFSCEATVEASV